MAFYTFFGSATPPGISVDPLGSTQTHGLDFTCSAASANVTAIRFWKDATDTGSHTGALYRTSDQALLGSVVFTGETASGWQRAAFPNPIPIAQGTTYRTSVSRTAAIAYKTSYTPPASGPLTPGSDYYINSTTVPSFPNTFAGGSNGLTDVEVDQPSCTYLAPSTAFPGTNNTGSGASSVGADIAVSQSGISVVGLYYYKIAGDTVAGRVARIYRTSDQSLVGSTTFVNETASGWQYAEFPTPVSLPTGFTYRICTQTGATYMYRTGFTGMSAVGAVMGPNSAYLTGATFAYPTNVGNNAWNMLDVLLDGTTLAPTAIWVAQALLEAWVLSPKLTVAQVLAETWVQRSPPTSLIDAQALLETWVSRNAPAEQLIIAQALLEVWTAKTSAQPMRLSSQVI